MASSARSLRRHRRAQSGEVAVTAGAIREKINEMQQASLGLFQKVYEKRNAEEQAKEAPAEEKKDN